MGRKYTLETRAKMRAAQLGKKHTPEAKAKISAASLGRKHTPEARAKISAALRGREISPEWRAKLRAAQLGKKATPEARANMSAAQKGRKFSPEHRANKSAAQMGRVVTPEMRAKIGAAHLGMKSSPEARRKMSEARLRFLKKYPIPTGPANHCWRGGDTKYGPGFTNDLRRIVRWLYDDRCFLCGEKPEGKKLAVHHIDYDKMNNTIDNLVPLCHSHHSQTNGRRDYWQDLLQGRKRECA